MSQVICKYFEFKGIKFVVRVKEGKKVYRDAAHFGGPWSDVDTTLKISSFDRTFKNLLSKTAREVSAAVSISPLLD